MYRIEKVERIPAELDDDLVYLSDEYELAALKCACGCGHRVTLLVGDGHEVKETAGRAHVWPSIGVWDAPCRSHFWIQDGQVLWAEQWSESRIQSAMERQLQRHADDTKARKPWYARLWDAVTRLVKRS